MSINKKDLWIGIGIGTAVGLTTGYFVGSATTKMKAEKEIKRVRRNAYLKGQSDAEAEAKQVIDNLTDNVVFVDSTDNAEEIKKKISDHFRKQEEEEKAQEEAANQVEDEAKTDEAYAEKPGEEDKPPMPFTIAGNNVIFYGKAGTEIRYPKHVIVDKANHLLSDLEIRENLKSIEPDIQKLKVIWNTMGWGTFLPDPDDPDTWGQNLNIDDDDQGLGDEPEEKTLERQRYLDIVEKYIAHPEEAPQIIDRQDFEDECYLEKLYFDYYDVDNKFVENTDMNSPVDGFTMFGFVNGNDLFEARRAGDNDDPDIIYVRNFKMNCVMEVTRYHRAYSEIVDGSAYVHGGTN